MPSSLPPVKASAPAPGPGSPASAAARVPFSCVLGSSVSSAPAPAHRRSHSLASPPSHAVSSTLQQWSSVPPAAEGAGGDQYATAVMYGRKLKLKARFESGLSYQYVSFTSLSQALPNGLNLLHPAVMSQVWPWCSGAS